MENPKMVGSNLIDCVPQHGPCPNGCDECYYNKWFYAGHNPVMPTVEETVGKIVRVNSGNDSANDKERVLDATRKFSHKFYNTIEPDLAFDDCPVVITVNPKQDTCWTAIGADDAETFPPGFIGNLMYVRVRVNTWNLPMVKDIIEYYTKHSVPVVLTFMRYYDIRNVKEPEFYERRVHVSHEYWDIKETVWFRVMSELPSKYVFTCGTPVAPYCRDCGVCETLYWRWVIVEGIEELYPERS